MFRLCSQCRHAHDKRRAPSHRSHRSIAAGAFSLPEGSRYTGPEQHPSLACTRIHGRSRHRTMEPSKQARPVSSGGIEL
eukprot:XP_001709816.1 Hypothetical protein GL50803_32163 [Giardia lamblia ATCC 50803]